MSTTVKIYPTLPAILGVHPDNVLSIDFDINQLGGSFDVTLIGRDFNYFTQNTVVNVFGSLQGIIGDITYANGSSGKLTRIYGHLTLPNTRIVKARTYMSTQSFRVPGGDFSESSHIANNTVLYEEDPSITFIDNMTFSNLFQRICSDHGIITFFLGSYINYPIYRYTLSASRKLLESLEELAQHAACNITINPLGINVIPWGENSNISLSLYNDDLLNNFDYTEDISNYDSVQIQSSSEITPYNSSYIGKPERIGSLSFVSGPSQLNDISIGYNNLADTKQWEFPVEVVSQNIETAKSKTSENSWFSSEMLFNSTETKEGDKVPVAFHPYSSTLLTKFWDYIVERVGNLDYRSFYRKLATYAPSLKTYIDEELKSNVISDINDYEYKESRILTLIRWSRARTKIEAVGDIHPYIYVVPSNVAPEITALDDLSIIPDRQELSLVSPGLTDVTGIKSISGTSIETFSFPEQTPPALSGIVPDGIGFVADFNVDGSFYVDAVFNQYRRKKKYVSSHAVTFSYYADSLVTPTNFGTGATLTMAKNSQNGLITLNGGNDDGLKNYAANFMSALGRFSRLIVVGTSLPSSNWDPDTTKATELSSTILTARKAVEVSSDLNNTYAAEDSVNKNTYYINSAAPVSENGNSSKVQVEVVMDRATPQAISGSSFKFAKERTSYNTFNYSKVQYSHTGQYESKFVDSGLNEENTETIQGSWTLYGLRRKTYPAVYFAQGSGQVSQSVPLREFLVYKGVPSSEDEEPQINTQGPNIKFINSSLVTDYIDQNSSHIVLLGRAIYKEINRKVKLFTISFPMQTELTSSIPSIGTTCKVQDVYGSHTGTIINVKGSISRQSGAIITVNTGRLPIL